MVQSSTSSDNRVNPLVLIVDDDENARLLAEKILKRAAFDVISASDGNSAVAFARERQPDAVILDLRLPGMDGYEVCRALKTEDSTRNIAVVVLSAHHNRESVMKALQSGADDFLVKPLDPPVLLHKINSYIAPEKDEEEYAEERTFLEGEESRQYVRLYQEAEAVLHLPVTLADISEGGVGIVSDSPIQTGSVMELKSPVLVELLDMAQAPVRVRYCLRVKKRNQYRMGAEFVGFGEKERKRIRQFIFRKQAARVKPD